MNAGPYVGCALSGFGAALQQLDYLARAVCPLTESRANIGRRHCQ